MVSWNKAAVAAVAMAAGTAMAGTVDLNFVGVSGGGAAMKLRVAGTTYYAGHMMHTFASGARMGESFNSFCIDVAEVAVAGTTSYEIVDLADAPMPGAPYGQAKADAVSAVIANAIALGWIDGRLQGDAGQAGYLGKMGAIQAAVWEALGFDVQIGAAQTSSTLAAYYNMLMDEATFDATLRTPGLHAAVAGGQQDMLYIVPLPPAAFAGAGLLAVGFGVRSLRRR